MSNQIQNANVKMFSKVMNCFTFSHYGSPIYRPTLDYRMRYFFVICHSFGIWALIFVIRIDFIYMFGPLWGHNSSYSLGIVIDLSV